MNNLYGMKKTCLNKSDSPKIKNLKGTDYEAKIMFTFPPTASIRVYLMLLMCSRNKLQKEYKAQICRKAHNTLKS